MLGGAPERRVGARSETGECSALTQEQFAQAQRSYLHPPTEGGAGDDERTAFLPCTVRRPEAGPLGAVRGSGGRAGGPRTTWTPAINTVQGHLNLKINMKSKETE